MSNKKIRVFVVDDSSVFIKFLTEELVKASPNIEIVGYAMSASEAMRKIPSINPDVVTLDIEMPRTNGIEFLKELLPKHLVPVILVSSLNVTVFDALANGAVDFVKKPDLSRNYSSKLFITTLVNKINGASTATVKLPRSFGGLRGGTLPGNTTQTNRLANSSVSASAASPAAGRPVARTSPAAPAAGNSANSLKLTTKNPRINNLLIALGASTGGTEATLQVLQHLPPNTPGIVITQHMPEGFTAMYAQRLNRLCNMEVREAVDGDVVTRGTILIAPGGDLHMKVVKLGGHYTVRLFKADKVNGHRPSVDVLFRSAAQAAGQNAVGMILTGMGQDGAYGLLEMRKAGAYTIGQNKESCVVYGMPMVAQNIGAVCLQASCDNMANVLINYLNKL